MCNKECQAGEKEGIKGTTQNKSYNQLLCSGRDMKKGSEWCSWLLLLIQSFFWHLNHNRIAVAAYTEGQDRQDWSWSERRVTLTRTAGWLMVHRGLSIGNLFTSNNNNGSLNGILSGSCSDWDGSVQRPEFKCQNESTHGVLYWVRRRMRGAARLVECFYGPEGAFSNYIV